MPLWPLPWLGLWPELPVKPVERAHAETEDERSTPPVTDPYSAILFSMMMPNTGARAPSKRAKSLGSMAARMAGSDSQAALERFCGLGN